MTPKDANDPYVIIPRKKAIEWLKKIELSPVNSLESKLLILAENEKLNKILKGLFVIAKDPKVAKFLIHSLEANNKLSWMLPYMICIMNAGKVLIPALLDELIMKSLENGSIQTQALEKLTELLNFCVNWKASKIDIVAVFSKSVSKLLNIYVSGILNSFLCSRGSFARHILVHIFSLMISCPWIIDGCMRDWLMVLDKDLLSIINAEISQKFSISLDEFLTSLDFQLKKVINEKTFPSFSNISGSILVILAYISTLKKSNPFQELFSQIFSYIQSSCDYQTNDLENWLASFRMATPKFVDIWWSNLSNPEIMKYMEKCIILSGVYSDEQMISKIFKIILANGVGLSNLEQVGKQGVHEFLSSWMFIVCTFECRFPGVFPKTMFEILRNLDGKNNAELISLFNAMHLTCIYESRHNLHHVKDILGLHEFWKRIFLFGNHPDPVVAKCAIDLVLEALPEKRFSIGMIYFILQSCLKRVFELCLNPSESIIVHDKLQESFIRLIVVLIKDYHTVDIIVDFVMDSFYSVFSTKELISIETINASNAACRLLFLPIFNDYKVYDPNGNESALSPSMITSHVSRKIRHYVPRDISRARRIHNEPEVLSVYERIPIVWDLYLLSASDATSHGYLISLLQPQAAVLADWWNTTCKNSEISSKFPIQLYTTESIFSIYAATNAIKEPENSIKMLIPYLKGFEIHILLLGYCGYIESRFDLLQIGESNEWFEHKLVLPLQKINQWRSGVSVSVQKKLSAATVGSGCGFFMGILTFLLSKSQNKPKDLARTIVRRKAIANFLWFCKNASWIFFILSLILLAFLPVTVKKLRPDENALSIGQLHRQFSRNDFEYADHIKNSLKLKDLSEKREFITKEFENIRLKTFTQRFNTFDNETGYNTMGILRAPRADGTESIVISAPWTCGDGKDNSFGIGLLLAFSKFAAKKSIWAKDLIFLVLDKTPTGSLAWLNAYHGVEESKVLKFENLKYHAGVIQAALNLEFCGDTDGFSGVGLYPVNLNGQLPNADLIATLFYSFYYEGVNIWSHDQVDTWFHPNEKLRSYVNNGKKLLSFFWHQALGMPNFDHSFYQKFKIEAATVRGIRKTDDGTIESYRFGRAIECSLYSLNTLLERLHHSFWFYLLSSPDQVVLLSIYIGPVIAVSASLIFYGIYLWFLSVDPKAVVTDEIVEEKYYKRPGAVKVHSVNGHDISTHIKAFAKVFLHSIGLFYFSNNLLLIYPKGFNGYSFVDLIMFIMVMARFKKGFVKVPKLNFRTGKSIACLGIGMMLIALATINPSLSVVFAIPLVPTFLSLSKNSVISYALLLLSFPVDAILIYSHLDSTILGQSLASFLPPLKGIVQNWILHGNYILPLVCCLYYPWILIGFILVGNNE